MVRNLNNDWHWKATDTHDRVVFFRKRKIKRADNTYIALNSLGNENYYQLRHRRNGPAMFKKNLAPGTDIRYELQWYLEGENWTKPVSNALVQKFGSVRAALRNEASDYELIPEAARHLREKLGFE